MSECLACNRPLDQIRHKLFSDQEGDWLARSICHSCKLVIRGGGAEGDQEELARKWVGDVRELFDGLLERIGLYRASHPDNPDAIELYGFIRGYIQAIMDGRITP